MNKYILAGGALSLSLLGCEVVSKLVDTGELFSLGVIPAQGFADVNSPNYGAVKIFLGKDGGMNSALGMLEIESDSSVVTLEEVDDIKGNQQGDLLVLVDGSGSLEQIGCEICPSDPLRYRVAAVKELTQSLHDCAADWRIGLMEFGPRASDEFSRTYVLTDYTVKTEAILESADGLTSEGGTPLWDSLVETLHSMDDSIQENYSTLSLDQFGKGIIIVSDGKDTESYSVVEDVIDLASELQIPISAVGLGGSSDVSDGFSVSAVDELRDLAEKTGGFYASVSSPIELPELSSKIASAYCGGYSEAHARFLTPPVSGEIVSGVIRLKNSGFSTPFSFRAP